MFPSQRQKFQQIHTFKRDEHKEGENKSLTEQYQLKSMLCRKSSVLFKCQKLKELEPVFQLRGMNAYLCQCYGEGTWSNRLKHIFYVFTPLKFDLSSPETLCSPAKLSRPD